MSLGVPSSGVDSGVKYRLDQTVIGDSLLKLLSLHISSEVYPLPYPLRASHYQPFPWEKNLLEPVLLRDSHDFPPCAGWKLCLLPSSWTPLKWRDSGHAGSRILSGQPSFGALLRFHFVVSISKDFCHFLANSTPAHREHICINFLIQCIAKFI